MRVDTAGGTLGPWIVLREALGVFKALNEGFTVLSVFDDLLVDFFDPANPG